MNERVRDMVRENHVRVDELIYPIFVIEGENICEPVESMPGIYQYSIDRLHGELDRVREVGIPAVLLFGIPAHKDEQGSGAYAEDGIVPQAIRYIKKNYKELVVVADACLCEYTSHGHCGLICDGEVLNDETLPLLSKASVVYAKAGADIITVHAEACTHLDRVVHQIKDCGKKAAVAINPATPLSAIEYVLPELDMVLVMTVNPGFGGQKYIPYCGEKVRELRKMITEKNLDVDIQVDGGVKALNIAEIAECGANIFVCGSAVFEGNIEKNVKEILEQMNK